MKRGSIHFELPLTGATQMVVGEGASVDLTTLSHETRMGLLSSHPSRAKRTWYFADVQACAKLKLTPSLDFDNPYV